MTLDPKEKINIAVETLKSISKLDLADLCNITEQAIKAGGGFECRQVDYIILPVHYIISYYFSYLETISRYSKYGNESLIPLSFKARPLA